jgi:hypothetical protein
MDDTQLYLLSIHHPKGVFGWAVTFEKAVVGCGL